MRITKSIDHIMSVGIVYLGISCFVALDAYSATKSDSFRIKGRVKKRCRITGVDFNFGEYDPVDVNLATDLNGLGEVRVRCNRGTTANVGFDLGIHASGAIRHMAGLAGIPDLLTYELYSDASRTIVWGNAVPAWVVYTALDRSVVSIPIYGKIPMAQDVGVGEYEDTLTATINF